MSSYAWRQLVRDVATELFLIDYPDAKTTDDITRAAGTPFEVLLANATGLRADVIKNIIDEDDLLDVHHVDGVVRFPHDRARRTSAGS